MATKEGYRTSRRRFEAFGAARSTCGRGIVARRFGQNR
jgi:hypothetical protein